jgi:hypothetical protein
MSRRLRIGSIVVLALLLVGTASFAAWAQNDSNENAGKFNADQLKEAYQEFVSKLADNLGVDEDEVQSALEATKEQMLDEAVQQGILTQEQADKIAENENGFGFGFGFGSGPRAGGGGPGFGHNIDAIAGILDRTADELKTEMEAGKKLDQIVTESGLTMEQFQEKLLAAEKEQISQDLADGKITQEQADKMLQGLGKRLEGPPPPERANDDE